MQSYKTFLCFGLALTWCLTLSQETVEASRVISTTEEKDLKRGGTDNVTIINSAQESNKRQEIECCRLGHIAGMKGYHCNPFYYAAHIYMRNKLRAHNRRMNFHINEKTRSFAQRTMKNFEECAHSQAIVFKRCCKLAAQQFVRTSQHRKRMKYSRKFFSDV